jgi:cytochrome c-type biogenesis protein CcmH
MRRILLVPLDSCLAVWIFCVPTSEAREFPPEVERQASEVFGSVMSPFCPGKLIGDCPSPAAMQLRETIRERIAAGESADSIKEELYGTYGEYLRAAPPARGFDLLAWLVPSLLVALGAAGIVARISRRRGAMAISGNRGPRALDPDAKARLDAELAKAGYE